MLMNSNRTIEAKNNYGSRLNMTGNLDSKKVCKRKFTDLYVRNPRYEGSKKVYLIPGRH